RPMTAVEPKRAAPRRKERAAVCERNQCIRRPEFGGAEATVVVAEVAVELELNTVGVEPSANTSGAARLAPIAASFGVVGFMISPPTSSLDGHDARTAFTAFVFQVSTASAGATGAGFSCVAEATNPAAKAMTPTSARVASRNRRRFTSPPPLLEGRSSRDGWW